MKPTARLIVIESVIPKGPAFNLGKWTDLQMLVCVGGRERTESEYRVLLSGAGINPGSGCYCFSAEPACRQAGLTREP
jgi:O-methyltransferase domain